MGFKSREREKEYHHRYYIVHRELKAAQNKRVCIRRRYTVKMETLRHYSNKEIPSCEKCGETDLRVLQLDHIHGGGRKQRIQLGLTGGGWRFYSILKAQGYPKGFQVLCANCNIIKQYEEGKLFLPTPPAPAEEEV